MGQRCKRLRCAACKADESCPGGLYRINPATGGMLPEGMALCSGCFEDACRSHQRGESLRLLRQSASQVANLHDVMKPRRRPS